MRGISWKALPIATIAYAVVLVFAVALIHAAAAIVALASHGRAASRAFDAFAASPAAFIFEISISLIAASLAAGYLAARTAKRQHWLNGTLATIGPTLLSLYGLTHGLLFDEADDLGPWLHAMTNVVIFVGGPMMGAFGGYLAELRQAQIEAMTSEDRVAHDAAALKAS